MFGRATIRLGIGPHSSSLSVKRVFFIRRQSLKIDFELFLSHKLSRLCCIAYALIQGGPKSVHFSIHHNYRTVQGIMKRFSPRCSEKS